MSFKDHVNDVKKFDFGSLDFNSIGLWPLFIRLILFLILFVGLLVSGWFFYLVDSYEGIETVKKQEVELREVFSRRYPESSNLEEYQEQMVRIQLMFDRLLNLLPAETEVPSLLQDITNSGEESGLEFEEIRLLSESGKEYYIELPIQITVEGHYHNLGAFTASIAGLSRIVTLHDFTLTPLANERLRMNILAKTYRNKK